MLTPFKLTTANINKLTEIGIKPASVKVVEELIKEKKPIDRTNLEARGLSTEEINNLMEATTSEKEEHVPEIKRGIIKIDGIDDRHGYSLVMRYDIKQEKDGVENIIINEEVYSINLGQATFEYDNKLAPDTFKLLVKSPSGDFVKIKIEASEGLELDSKKAELGKKQIEVIEKIQLITTDKKPISVTKLKGRLLSKNPSRKLEKIQIVIQVSVADNPQENDFFPVCYAVTEQGGYFFTSQLEIIPSDLEKIKAARALIGLSEVTPQNIRLFEQDIDGNKIQTLPEKVILFIDDEEPDNKKIEDDCDCDCKDLEFHDKKALEEFSFYSVVRTTEPLIEAYEISDVKKIDLKEIVSDIELKGILGGYVLPPSAINNFIIKNGPITKLNASNLLNIAKQYQQIVNVKLASKIKEPKFKRGRIDLDGNNEVDWDDKPTIYQATSIAHGHLLHFKQEWFNDGYTIGDLLYSLPLAPGQKKQIVVFDWDRKDSASNTQQMDYQESLYNSLSRDRDVNEIARASVSEHTKGESSANTWGVGGGIGGFIGKALFGVAGGFGKASSSASQSSSRNSTASSQQHINDRTVQSASSVRSQRATVIQTVSQGERFQVSAEVVANYNHCHAMTIQYFEVLRHFEIRTRLADVQECLFIPLKLSPFDRKKALRWRDILSRCLRKRFLLPGFNALERYDDAVEKCGEGNRQCIDKHYDGLGIPNDRYAEEALQYLEGELYLEFQIKMPQILPDVTETLASTGWSAFGGLLGGGILQSLFEAEVKNEARKDEAFAKNVGPKVADSIINGLQFHAVKNGQGGSSKLLPVDATLLSEFRNRTKLNVSLRMKGAFDGTLKREDIDFVRIAFGNSVTPSLISSLDTLIRGDYVRIIVHSGSMRYRTQSLHEYLFRDSNIKNDLRPNDTVNIFSPLSEKALKRPRLDDVELSNTLLHHLNENIEYYHQCIWLEMDAQRRFMLLDGLIAPGKGKGRSVASVVENNLIGIVGNCLVMPVAPGFQLDPTLDDNIDLFEHYYENPKDPLHISLPTKGVFAEAVMGKCNSCEKKDETRFWRWEESPIPDSPTTINPVSTPVPQNVQPNLEAKDFPTPIVNIQNAPALPDPQGYGALTTMLSNPNLFRDITGLSANQSNALGAMQSSLAAAQNFASMAKELESQRINQQQSDSIIDAIKNSGLPKETQNKLIQDHLEQRIDGGASKKAEKATENKKNEPSAMGIAKDAEAKGKPVKAETQDKEGNTQKVEVGAGNQGEQILAEAKGYYQLLKQKSDKPNSCWAIAATIMVSWKRAKELTVEIVLAEAGAPYLVKYEGDDVLRASEKDGFIEALNMVAEAPASYPLQEYIAMLNAYGPLWITTDANEEDGEFSPHARILYKITGISPTDEANAKFHFKDPAPGTGNEQVESFETFLKKYEQMVTDNDSGNLMVQIVHFKDLMGTGEGQHTASTTIRIRNRNFNTHGAFGTNLEPVRNCNVSLRSTSFAGPINISGTTNASGNLSLDFSSLPDGDYLLDLGPTDIFQQGATFSSLGDPSTIPPDRIWVAPGNIQITITNQRITAVAGSNVSLNGRDIEIRLTPAWIRSPNERSRGTVTADMIVIHHTAGSAVSPALNQFLSADTSAHYIIDRDGTIIKLVHESRAALHAGAAHWGGDDNINNRSIGIEIVHASSQNFETVQYDSLIFLLTDLTTSGIGILPHKIIGHSDIATNIIGNMTTAGRRLGRKSGDPGTLFDWSTLNNAGYGIYNMGGMIHPDSEYGGLFDQFPTISIQSGDRDSNKSYGGQVRATITSNVISEIQADLITIGYFCSVTGDFDTRTLWAVRMFNEHFFSGSAFRATKQYDRVDIDTANAIKGVLIMLGTV